MSVDLHHYHEIARFALGRHRGREPYRSQTAAA
jgi:hypothetical protein